MSRRNGELGELIAQSHLEGQGYKLLFRNYYSRYGEIDLVMKDGKMLVFVEVKMRSSMKFGSPLESVTWQKKEKIRKTIFGFLDSKKYHGNWRIDVIGIMTLANGEYEINHIKHAF